jgi:hypothetical protein
MSTQSERRQQGDVEREPARDRVSGAQVAETGTDDKGRVPGVDEIERPSAAERATMSSRDKAAADPTRSSGEAQPTLKQPVYRDRFIRSPEQNPPLNHPDQRSKEPLDDEEIERAKNASAPTGARGVPKPAPLEDEPAQGTQVQDWRGDPASVPGQPLTEEQRQQHEQARQQDRERAEQAQDQAATPSEPPPPPAPV